MKFPNSYSRTDLFKRYKDNPVLVPSMWPYRINSAFNAGATIYKDKVLLLVRIEDMKGFSHLSKAVSKNGLTDWVIDPMPTFAPDPVNYPEDHYGVEDPRIIKLENDPRYAIVYTSFSKGGPLVSLATTEDFINFTRLGIVAVPEDKDASLFPRKFNGRWALLHRPSPSNLMMGAHVWLSFSPDLKHWGDSSVLIPARKGSWWDAYRVGLGPQPIETPEGWLIIYHGVKITMAGGIYRLGLALLDLDDPRKVIRRSNDWVFGPNEIYERIGDVPDVTFPCGVVVKGDKLIMYYGAADTSVAVATASMKEVLDFIMKSEPMEN